MNGKMTSLIDRSKGPIPCSSGARGLNSSQRGSQMLESCFIAIPLFALTFLVLDVSMVVFLRSTFQHAVREGTRYAITGKNTVGPCQDDSIKATVKTAALGFLSSSPIDSTIHVHWINPVTGARSNNAHGNIVEVSVEGYRFGPLAPFWRSGAPVMVWATAYDMVEPVPGALACISNPE